MQLTLHLFAGNVGKPDALCYDIPRWEAGTWIIPQNTALMPTIKFPAAEAVHIRENEFYIELMRTDFSKVKNFTE